MRACRPKQFGRNAPRGRETRHGLPADPSGGEAPCSAAQRQRAGGILAEPVDVDVTASRLASRREISGEIAARIDAAVRAGHLPAQDTSLAATALLGALHESLVGPLAPDNLDDPGKMRDAVQTVTLLALRAVGVMDARARGLVVQAGLPWGVPGEKLVRGDDSCI